MVKLQPESNVDPALYPATYQWDLLVRKNYQINQKQLDKHTYHIQRLQRFLFSFAYPLKQDSEVISLNLLNKKKIVGEVQKKQLALYQQINPQIRNKYSRTFNIGSGISLFGYMVSGSVFAFTTYCNYSFQSRFVLTIIPLCIDLYRNSRNIKSQIESTELLDWVYNYRKAKSFAERHHALIAKPQLREIIGDSNLIQLGEQLISSITL